MQAIARLAAAGLLAMGLCGCASTVMDDRQSPMPYETGGAVVQTHKPLQCVPYAREHSDIKIYGDAYTWWDQAAGKYPRAPLPQEGAVMVLNNYAGPTRGHVAVVRATVRAREIRVDHANWLNDGAIYLNNPVEDVSSGNDWSLVRVFNLKTGSWGGRLYPVQGFIGGRGEDGRPDLVAGGAPRGATTLVGEIN
ncbi:MAG TPA: CHAP domain-containing protein [Rhizomicrobium sp.]|nr:CHAP domain-containing protein [Rhizomicrobium sp.]